MLVYGRNVAYEFLEKKEKIRKVYLQEDFHDKNLIIALKKFNIPMIFRSKTELDQLANGVHQGIILDVVDFDYSNYKDYLDKEDAIFVILDHLEDPHNLGAIIRTAEAAGVDAVILPKNRGVSVNATVMKTSVGAIENIPVCMVTNLNETIKDLKEHGFWIVGTALENSTDYRAIDYSGKIALVIGNEGEGMSDKVTKNCDFLVVWQPEL